jgi:chemotaxis protein MotB
LPITNPNSEFSSNWELSLERASVIAAVLKSRGYTQSIIVKGYSSGNYDDFKPEMREEIKEKYARRVDIKIMSDDGRRTLEQRLRLE